jgi:predicted RNA-binding protein associated with RNAse of E/G family
VFELQNFRLYTNKEKSTIAISQEPLLINCKGRECVIEEKLLQWTKFRFTKKKKKVEYLSLRIG